MIPAPSLIVDVVRAEPGEHRDDVRAPRLRRPGRVVAEPLGLLRERDQLGRVRPRRRVAHREPELHTCDAKRRCHERAVPGVHGGARLPGGARARARGRGRGRADRESAGAGEGRGPLGAAPPAGGRRHRARLPRLRRPERGDRPRRCGRSSSSTARRPTRGTARSSTMFGTPEQKERFLRPLVEGETRSFFSMTEPEVSGADPTGLRTRAVLDGDEWVIDGHKWFSSGAEGAGFGVVMAVTDPDAEPHRRMSQILVPADTPGIADRGGADLRPSRPRLVDPLRGLVRRACASRPANILGERGDGFRIAQKRLGPGRIHHVMRWLGQMQRAFELMCSYSLEREAFGGPLAEKQTVQNWIAESAAEIQACRLMTLDAAHKIDAGDEARVEISLIKFYAARVLNEVIDRAVQVHGGLGLTDRTPLAAMLADGPRRPDLRRPGRGAQDGRQPADPEGVRRRRHLAVSPSCSASPIGSGCPPGRPRELLARVQQVLRVEEALDLLVQVERARAPLARELAALQEAEAVLARDRAAERGRPGRRDPRPRARRGASSSGLLGGRPGTTSAGCRRPRGRTRGRSGRGGGRSRASRSIASSTRSSGTTMSSADHAAAPGEHREREPGAPAPERGDALRGRAARRRRPSPAPAASTISARDPLRLGQRAVGLGEQQEPGAVGHAAGEGRAAAGERLARRAARAPRRRSRCRRRASSAAQPSAVAADGRSPPAARPPARAAA